MHYFLQGVRTPQMFYYIYLIFFINKKNYSLKKLLKRCKRTLIRKNVLQTISSQT